MKILIATAFPTHGAGSGALVTTQAKSYVEDGHDVVIITGNNRTDFDKLSGVKYHVVPFTGEGENPEKIEGQAPFNYLMFTTHTESTANFWNINLEDLEIYCDNFKKVLLEEVKQLNPDVIHAQHNWLLSSEATRMGKPVVTTIHGTDLMGYEKAKIKLLETQEKLKQVNNISKEDLGKIDEIYNRSNSYGEIKNHIKNLVQNNELTSNKADIMKLIDIYNDKRKYEFYINESENSAKNSDKIIVISDAQKDKFNSLFPYASDKVELLENGYDPKVFYVDDNVKKEDVIPLLKSNVTEDGKIDLNYDNLILFVGKFADFKGIDSLLTASKIYEEELEKEGKKPLTIIVGSGALDDKLKNQAERLGLKNTHFVGRHPHDVICKLQNLADVSLIPSRNEPFGLVVIEGTACGHPVIASNSGGIPGILNTTKEELPNEDIIQTKLGVLVKPLPDRPEILSDEEKEKLDYVTPEYVTEKENRESIIENCGSEFGMDKNELKEYFDEYTESTKALAKSVVKTIDKEFEFDNKEIAEYTSINYSQDVIREKLLNIFKDAKTDYENKKKIR